MLVRVVLTGALILVGRSRCPHHSPPLVTRDDAGSSSTAVENATTIGTDHLAPALATLAEKHECLGEVRGAGVFWAIELVADPATREPLPASTMGRIKSELLARNLLPFVQDDRITSSRRASSRPTRSPRRSRSTTRSSASSPASPERQEHE